MMKKNLFRIAFALALCASLNAVALAGGKSKTVTFVENVKLGDTVIKRGTYKVSFDEQANELTISRGKDVVAKVKAHAQEHQNKSERSIMIRTGKKDNNEVALLSVNMGDKFAVIDSGKAVAATATGQ